MLGIIIVILGLIGYGIYDIIDRRSFNKASKKYAIDKGLDAYCTSSGIWRDVKTGERRLVDEPHFF